MKLEKVVIAGITYDVNYFEDIESVSTDKSRPYRYGELNYWERKIRLLDNKVKKEDDNFVFRNFMHEALHVLADALNISCLEGEENHSDLDTLATGLADMLVRNNMLRKDF